MCFQNCYIASIFVAHPPKSTPPNAPLLHGMPATHLAGSTCEARQVVITMQQQRSPPPFSAQTLTHADY